MTGDDKTYTLVVTISPSIQKDHKKLEAKSRYEECKDIITITFEGAKFSKKCS